MGRPRKYSTPAERAAAFRSRKRNETLQPCDETRNETPGSSTAGSPEAALRDATARNEMTRTEREELRRAVRGSFKVARQAVTALEAERLAEFEQQLATIYKPSDDPVWQELTERVEAVVDDAQRRISARCDELAIPAECRPDIGAGWYGRGTSRSASRRAELRKVAQSRLKANAEKAVLSLNTREAKVLLELTAGALTSAAARAFLAEIPQPEDLMPALSLAEFETGRLID